MLTDNRQTDGRTTKNRAGSLAEAEIREIGYDVGSSESLIVVGGLKIGDKEYKANLPF